MIRTEYTGIALDTLMDNDTKDLRVWIPELSPFTQEDPSEDLTTTSKVKNIASNTKYQANLKVVSYVVCEYYGNTKISRPNVHVGEQVRIFMYEDNNIYFWDVIGRDDELRTVEWTRYMISDKPTQLAQLIPHLSYYVEMDTRTGQRKAHIHLGQGTGEKVGYDLTFNMEASTV